VQVHFARALMHKAESLYEESETSLAGFMAACDEHMARA
jgi:hypothetical protein